MSVKFQMPWIAPAGTCWTWKSFLRKRAKPFQVFNEGWQFFISKESQSEGIEAQWVALLPHSCGFNPHLGLLFVSSFSCSPGVRVGFLPGSPISYHYHDGYAKLPPGVTVWAWWPGGRLVSHPSWISGSLPDQDEEVTEEWIKKLNPTQDQTLIHGGYRLRHHANIFWASVLNYCRQWSSTALLLFLQQHMHRWKSLSSWPAWNLPFPGIKNLESY